MIILAAFFISLDDLKNPMIAEGDAYSRFNNAYKDFQNKILFEKYTGPWLPIHFTILSLPFYFGIGHMGPRIITLILNLLSFISLYFYTKNITKNKKTAILSVFLYLILPLRIILSTQTLTEGVFMFFLLNSLIFLTKTNKNYFVSSLFLFIAQGIRFEAWLILPFIFIIVICDTKLKLINKINYLILFSAFPIIWIINNYYLYKNPFFFFSEKKEIASQRENSNYFNWINSFNAWIDKLLINFSRIDIFLYFSSLFLTKTNKKKIFYFSLPIYFFFILVFQVYIGSMEWEPHRYLSIPITLALPFLADAILQIGIIIKKRINIKISLVSLILILTNIAVFHYKSFDSLYHMMNWNMTFYKDDFNNLIINFKKIYENKPIKISYFFSKEQTKNLDQPFFYFIEEAIGENFESNAHNYFIKDYRNEINIETVVWEKDEQDIYLNLEKDYNILYENEIFLIMEKKSNQK